MKQRMWAIIDCTCGCRYCYVPRMPGFPSREVFRAAATLRRPDILDLIERDAVALQAQGNTEPVFLCFTCDSCVHAQEYNGESKISVLREARADGWTIEAKDLCPRCSGVEEE